MCSRVRASELCIQKEIDYSLIPFFPLWLTIFIYLFILFLTEKKNSQALSLPREITTIIFLLLYCKNSILFLILSSA